MIRRWAPAVLARGAAPGRGAHRALPTSERFTAPRLGIGFWTAMWTLVVAAEFAELVPIIFAGGARLAGADVVYRLVGGSFAAFGLVAWRRCDCPAAGEVLEDIWTPAFIALVLSFVSGGRLVSRVDRVIVAAVFVVVFVMDVFSMLFVEQPGNVLLAFPSEPIYGAVDTTQRSLLIVLAIVTCDRGPSTRSVTSSQTNISTHAAPAMLGNNARRRGGDAARHRPPSTTHVTIASTMSSDRCVVSTTP